VKEVRIGTCSWKFPSWHGLVYSEPKPINYLAEYATQYDTVEVDQWFWSLFGENSVKLPKEADVEAYRRAVSGDFRFTVKAPNSVTLTHFYRKKKSDPLEPNPYFLSVPLYEKFLLSLAPIRDVLGPILFQFEYLNKQKMASQDQFLASLESFVAEIPSEYQCAVEVRNPKYLNEAYFGLLARTGLSPVLLQGYWMPPVAQVYEQWRSLIGQLQFAVIRLLGPDRQGIEKETGKKWDRIVAPKDDELGGIVDVVKDLEGRDIEIYLNVNNHYEGSAPRTIERIKALL
jgi:uncharacterized protein YecE (DUF72 family)